MMVMVILKTKIKPFFDIANSFDSYFGFMYIRETVADKIITMHNIWYICVKQAIKFETIKVHNIDVLCTISRVIEMKTRLAKVEYIWSKHRLCQYNIYIVYRQTLSNALSFNYDFGTSVVCLPIHWHLTSFKWDRCGIKEGTLQITWRWCFTDELILCV